MNKVICYLLIVMFATITISCGSDSGSSATSSAAPVPLPAAKIGCGTDGTESCMN